MANDSMNGATKNTVKMMTTVILGVGIIFTAGWVGWVSATQIDQEKRIYQIEHAQKLVIGSVGRLQEEMTRANIELASMRGLLLEIRADQIRKQKNERR